MARNSATDVPVLEQGDIDSVTIDDIRRAVELAIGENRSDAIVFGCGDMTDLAKQLTDEFSLPVDDGPNCTETLVPANLRTLEAGTCGSRWPRRSQRARVAELAMLQTPHEQSVTSAAECTGSGAIPRWQLRRRRRPELHKCLQDRMRRQ